MGTELSAGSEKKIAKANITLVGLGNVMEKMPHETALTHEKIVLTHEETVFECD